MVKSSALKKPAPKVVASGNWERLIRIIDESEKIEKELKSVAAEVDTLLASHSVTSNSTTMDDPFIGQIPLSSTMLTQSESTNATSFRSKIRRKTVRSQQQISM